jgi:hypothetical protein
MSSAREPQPVEGSDGDVLLPLRYRDRWLAGERVN